MESVVEYGMEKCGYNLCVFRMAGDGKVELTMAFHSCR